MDRLDRYEFTDSKGAHWTIYRWPENTAASVNTGFEDERADHALEDEILRLAERERDLLSEIAMEREHRYIVEEDRDAYKMASEEGKEIDGELSAALAVLAGERLIPCGSKDEKGAQAIREELERIVAEHKLPADLLANVTITAGSRCPGHLGEKASAVLTHALAAWRALQEGNEKAAQRIAELEADEATNRYMVASLRAIREALQAAGLWKKRENLQGGTGDCAVAAIRRLRALEADNKVGGFPGGLLHALLAEIQAHREEGESALGTLRRIISQWLARGVKLAVLEKDSPAGWLNPAQAAIIRAETSRATDRAEHMKAAAERAEGEEKRLTIENARLLSQLLAAGTEKVRLAREGREAGAKIEAQCCAIADQLVARDRFTTNLLKALGILEEPDKWEDAQKLVLAAIEQLKVDVAYWRRMAVRDDPPMTDDPLAVAAFHQRLAEKGYLKAENAEGRLPWTKTDPISRLEAGILPPIGSHLARCIVHDIAWDDEKHILMDTCRRE